MSPRPPARGRGRRLTIDTPRLAAYEAMTAVAVKGAYANLALSEAITRHQLTGLDAAFTTALVSGTARLWGTHDRIITVASRRLIDSLDPPVQQVLRLACQQLLAMDVPSHAAVSSSVELARRVAGERVTGLVNAVCRRIGAKDLDGWVAELSRDEDHLEALGTRTHHPRWIVEAYVDIVGDEAEEALRANNEPAVPTLVVRPGLLDRDALLADRLGAEATRYSPFGVRAAGAPGALRAVGDGRAGVQDEGSQLTAWALSRVTGVPAGPWLDLCAGPGGKAALLNGLARQSGTWLLANELHPHRATLVRQALAAHPDGHVVVCGDGLAPGWQTGSFSRVLADVPCSGLGALRRRPESRWRHSPGDLDELVPLQHALLDSAISSAAPGGVVAYVTCSPHVRETVEVVRAALERHPGLRLVDAPSLLPGVPRAARPEDPRLLQLWPNRHGTDAMFMAVLMPAG